MNLGKNIRALRTLYGETQEQLGRAINLSNKTVHAYESETHWPDPENLQKIADRYGRTIDSLINDDLSLFNLTLAGMNWGIIRRDYLRIVFPSICSNEALKNPHFQSGYEMLLRLYNIDDENLESDPISFDSVIESFVLAGQDSECLESIANLLCILFLQYQLMPDPNVARRMEELLANKKFAKAFMPDRLPKGPLTITPEEAERKKTYASRHEEDITGLIQILKAYPNYAPIGDYYLALRFLVGLANNSLSDAVNQTVGTQLLIQLGKMDNKYAADCLNLMAEVADAENSTNNRTR